MGGNVVNDNRPVSIPSAAGLSDLNDCYLLKADVRVDQDEGAERSIHKRVQRASGERRNR